MDAWRSIGAHRFVIAPMVRGEFLLKLSPAPDPSLGLKVCQRWGTPFLFEADSAIQRAASQGRLAVRTCRAPRGHKVTLGFLLLVTILGCRKASPPIIPRPVNVQNASGVFTLLRSSRIVAAGASASTAELL